MRLHEHNFDFAEPLPERKPKPIPEIMRSRVSQDEGVTNKGIRITLCIIVTVVVLVGLYMWAVLDYFTSKAK